MRENSQTLEMSSPARTVDSGRFWRSRTALALLNVIGGTAVVGSYIHGLLANPMTRGDVWGGIPEGLKPLYTVSMLCAAVGYFPFTYYVLFRIDASRVRIAERFGYGTFHLLYGCVLVFSAVWMPLTFAMLEQPSLPLWYAIRLVLAVVGIASLGILAALLTLQPRPSGFAHTAAVAGCVAFCLQTAVLDALVWPAFFPL